MKKVIFTLAVIGLFASCSKILDQLTTFKFTRDASFTLPKTATTGVPINLSTPAVETLYEKEFANHNSNIDKVEYIKVTALKLQVTDPVSANFNFLKSVVLSLSADGLPDRVIASQYDIQNDNIQELSLDVNAEDVKAYLTEDTYKLKVIAEVDELITQDYEVKAVTTFEVKAKTE